MTLKGHKQPRTEEELGNPHKGNGKSEKCRAYQRTERFKEMNRQKAGIVTAKNKEKWRNLGKVGAENLARPEVQAKRDEASREYYRKNKEARDKHLKKIGFKKGDISLRKHQAAIVAEKASVQNECKELARTLGYDITWNKSNSGSIKEFTKMRDELKRIVESRGKMKA